MENAVAGVAAPIVGVSQLVFTFDLKQMATAISDSCTHCSLNSSHPIRRNDVGQAGDVSHEDHVQVAIPAAELVRQD